MLHTHTIALADIRVTTKRAKTLDPAKVQQIAEDMIEHGQTTPIQLRTEGDGYILVEGLHRLEALRALGETEIHAYLVQARKF